MENSFYKDFEDRYRGSRELVMDRLQVYLPFVEPLKTIHNVCNALDLGCGRGEWLQVLSEQGFHARGVDLDDDMLAECRDRNLEVERKDAVTCLRSLPDESEAIISGFHVAEHLPFSELRALVSEAWRVLKPAGLLILETPNPENLVVGASTFYLDPTHERPLPPALLFFLAEHSGFERTKVIRLNEANDVGVEGPVSLATVLKGVSPDYSIVAQKGAAGNLVEAFGELFDKQYGTTLEATLTRYDEQFDNRLDSILFEQRAEREAVENIESELLLMRETRENLESGITTEREARHKVESELMAEREMRKKVESELMAEREARQNVESALTAVYASSSWRITWPFRGLFQLIIWSLRIPRRIVLLMLQMSRSLTSWLVLAVARFVATKPGLSARLSWHLDQYPSVKGWLAHLVASTKNKELQTVSNREPEPGAAREPEYLSAEAQRIYRELRSARDKHSNT